jgi:hypothetical protein
VLQHAGDAVAAPRRRRWGVAGGVGAPCAGAPPLRQARRQATKALTFPTKKRGGSKPPRRPLGEAPEPGGLARRIWSRGNSGHTGYVVGRSALDPTRTSAVDSDMSNSAAPDRRCARHGCAYSRLSGKQLLDFVHQFVGESGLAQIGKVLEDRRSGTPTSPRPAGYLRTVHNLDVDQVVSSRNILP